MVEDKGWWKVLMGVEIVDGDTTITGDDAHHLPDGHDSDVCVACSADVVIGPRCWSHRLHGDHDRRHRFRQVLQIDDGIFVVAQAAWFVFACVPTLSHLTISPLKPIVQHSVWVMMMVSAVNEWRRTSLVVVLMGDFKLATGKWLAMLHGGGAGVMVLVVMVMMMAYGFVIAAVDDGTSIEWEGVVPTHLAHHVSWFLVHHNHVQIQVHRCFPSRIPPQTNRYFRWHFGDIWYHISSATMDGRGDDW